MIALCHTKSSPTSTAPLFPPVPVNRLKDGASPDRGARLASWAHLAVLWAGLLLTWPAAALELNTATEAELDGLSGFGPAFTARVMQARADRPFQDWADFIQRVKGVREPTAWRLSRQGVRIQQASFAPVALRHPRGSRD